MTKNAWDRYGKKGYKDYDIVAAGYKFNMTNLQAVCGIAQLKNIEKAWKRRRQIWRIYKEKLKNLPITLPFEEEKNSKHAYHLFTIIINSNREHFINYLKKNKIGIGIHYNSIGSFNFYKNKVKNFSKVPKSNYIGERILSLPLYESLKKKELNFIIEKITKYFD